MLLGASSGITGLSALNAPRPSSTCTLGCPPTQLPEAGDATLIYPSFLPGLLYPWHELPTGLGRWRRSRGLHARRVVIRLGVVIREL